MFVLITTSIFYSYGIYLFIATLMGKIPPNEIIGFRTRATLTDPRIWYEMNRLASIWMIGLHTLALLANIFTQKPHFVILAYVFWALILMAILVLIANRKARNLQ